MLLNTLENEKLFAKSVPVSLKDVYTNQLRTTQLFMTIEWQESSTAIYNRKVLVISLTDNNDPFFLYNLHLTEEDFQLLKASQDLLINFSSFPQHIIDYIEMCLLEEKNPQPKFILIFTINDQLGNVTSPSQLDIVETNQFKHLTHLSLKFVAATEATVRQYLATCFRNLKEERRQLQNKLAYLEQDFKDKLSSCQHTLNSKSQELEILRKEMNVELTMKESKYALELQEERNKLLNKQKEEEARIEKERKEKEHNFRKQIQQLEARVSCLDTLNKELQDKNYKHESTIRELRSNVLSLNDETRRLKENLQSYKQKCENLHSELRDKQSQICHQKDKIMQLEHELRSKGQSVMRFKEQNEADAKLKKSLQEELDKVKLQLEMSEKTIKSLENEKLESNKIISKLQDKVKAGIEKLQSRNDFSLKQEQKLKEKEKALLEFKKETLELRTLLDAKNAEIKSLNENLSIFHKKAETMEKDLRTRDNVIKWLNRQLTDRCVVPQYTPPSNLGSSPNPSTVAQKQLAKINSSVSRKSTGNAPPPTLATTSSSAPKIQSQRKETPSPSQRRNNSTPTLSQRRNNVTPSHIHETVATDSAYCTSPSAYNATPDNNIQNLGFDPNEFNIDPSALSAAFGSDDNVLKHSTAKKQTKSSNVKTGASKLPKR